MTEQIIVQLNPDVPPTGSDLGIVNAARKSFGRRSELEDGKLKDKDKRLLEFLARGMTAGDFKEFVKGVSELGSDLAEGWDVETTLIERLWEWRNTPTHDTPFNHGFFSFEVKAPIFVARHLVKHEYLIMSEYSRRYITDEVEFYSPEVWRKASDDVKQGSSDEPVEGPCFVDTLGEYTHPRYVAKDTCKLSYLAYKAMLDSGVAPEQARMVLPQSLMTSWTWSGTMGAFANMCKLRLATDTQYETRVVAQKVYSELKKQFPVSAQLIVEGVT